jgi:hypothetical protein
VRRLDLLGKLLRVNRRPRLSDLGTQLAHGHFFYFGLIKKFFTLLWRERDDLGVMRNGKSLPSVGRFESSPN